MTESRYLLKPGTGWCDGDPSLWSGEGEQSLAGTHPLGRKLCIIKLLFQVVFVFSKGRRALGMQVSVLFGFHLPEAVGCFFWPREVGPEGIGALPGAF